MKHLPLYLALLFSTSAFAQKKSDSVVFNPVASMSIGVGIMDTAQKKEVAIRWNGGRLEILDTMGLILSLQKELKRYQTMLDHAWDESRAAYQAFSHFPSSMDAKAWAVFRRYVKEYIRISNKHD